MSEDHLIEFYLDGELYAGRARSIVPQVGDEVRFHGICYEVTKRVFLYDEPIYMAALDIRHLTLNAVDSPLLCKCLGDADENGICQQCGAAKPANH